jgi:hypothetical protein
VHAMTIDAGTQVLDAVDEQLADWGVFGVATVLPTARSAVISACEGPR